MTENQVNDVNALLSTAVNEHNNGNIDVARSIYQKVLDIEPKNGDATHLLGMLEYRAGNHEKGFSLVIAAHRLIPNAAIRKNIDALISHMRQEINAALVSDDPSRAELYLDMLLDRRMHYDICDNERLRQCLNYLIYSTIGTVANVDPRNYFGFLSYHVGHNRTSTLGKAFIKMSRDIINIAECDSSDFYYNGEAKLLWKASPFPIKTVFDVGANQGDWALQAESFFRNATIHSFEPVPATFETLSKAVAGHDRIRPSPFGLLERERTETVHLPSGTNTDATASIFSSNPGENTVECRFRSGMEYMQENGISHIDFLKIDTEGAEQYVLNGFIDMIRDHKITMMQCEYNRWALRAKFTLRDFYDLLVPHGYRIGKLRGDGVEFKAFDWDDDNLFGPNIVACHESHPDLMRAVAAPGFEPEA